MDMDIDKILEELDGLSFEERIAKIEELDYDIDVPKQLDIDMLDMPSVVDFDISEIPDMFIVNVLG